MHVCVCIRTGGLCSQITLCFTKINCLQKFQLILIIITSLILCTYKVVAELPPECMYNNTTTTSMLMYKCKV